MQARLVQARLVLFGGRLVQAAAVRGRLVRGHEYNRTGRIIDTKGQHLRHERANLARREIDHRHHLPTDKRFRRIERGDLRRGFFPANLGAKINHQLECGFACLGKG